MWMLAGLGVIVAGLVVVALIANSGRISSNTGNTLTQTGFKTQKRNACLTDLRNDRDDAHGRETDAVTNRLAVLDGLDPVTKKKLPEEIIGTEKQEQLAYVYSVSGLKARDERIALSKKLKQPTLNRLCGKPITDKNDIPN